MLPIMVNVADLPIAVVGDGFAAAQRLRILQASGAQSVMTFSSMPEDDVADLAGQSLVARLPSEEDFTAHRFRVVYLCDLPDAETNEILSWARDVGALVNVHDKQDMCDFHMPAILRHGNLQVTVSTDGKVAGLSRILRDFLRDDVLGPEWAERVDELGRRRAEWVAQRLPFADLKSRVEDYVEKRKWLSARRNVS